MIDTSKVSYTSSNNQCPKCKSYFTKEQSHMIENIIGLFFLFPFFINILGIIITIGNILFKKYLIITFVLFIIGVILFEIIKIKKRKVYCCSCNNTFYTDKT